MLDGVTMGVDRVSTSRFFLRDGRHSCPTLLASLHYLLALTPPQFAIQRDFLALTSLRLDGLPLFLGLAPFARLRALRALRAVGATGRFGGIDALSALPDLEELDLHGAEVDCDLRPLQRAARLHTLQVDGTVPDLRLPDLSALPRLRRLSLPPSTRRKTLRLLAGLPALEVLRVPRWEALSDLSALRRLPTLHTVSLAGCRSLTDVAPLAALPALRQLDLTGCRRLRDLSALAGVRTLQQLDLGRIPAAMTFSQGPQVLTGRGALETYFRRVARGTFPREKARLAPLYRRLRSLLHSSDAALRAQGLELLAALDEPELLDLLVQGSRVEAGRLMSGPAFLRGGQRPDAALDLTLLQALSARPGHPMCAELASIRSLTVERPSADQLGGLRPLRGLHTLRLSAVHTEADLSFLSQQAALRSLTLRDARSLHSLGGLPLGDLASLSLSTLPALRTLTLDAPALQSLSLKRCDTLEHLHIRAPRLTRLTLDQLPRLRTLTLEAPALEHLKLWRLHAVEAMDLTVPALRHAELDQFDAMRRLPPSLLSGGSLERLELSRMHTLEMLPCLCAQSRLERLGLHDVPRIQALPELPRSLTALRLENLIGLSDIQQLSTAPQLSTLRVRFARGVARGAGRLFQLPQLRTLELRAAGALSKQLGSELVVLSGNVQERLADQQRLSGR